MKIVITGGTGLIGRALTRYWIKEKHEMTILTRKVGDNDKLGSYIKFSEWNPKLKKIDPEVINGADAVINLAGASIGENRWSESYKKLILNSRIEGTRCLVETFKTVSVKPKLFISSSAVGYYGTSANETFTEGSPSGNDFLANVCHEWEATAQEAEKIGIRTVLIRTGLVLSHQGGALEKMLPVFRMGLGGPLASGRQWMSWIHIWDIVQLFDFILTHGEVHGAINACTPNPVSNLEFSRALARTLNRPCLMKVPAWVLNLALGEMSTLLVEGQKVLPVQAQNLGFQFSFSEIDSAFSNLLKS